MMQPFSYNPYSFTPSQNMQYPRSEWNDIVNGAMTDEDDNLRDQEGNILESLTAGLTVYSLVQTKENAIELALMSPPIAKKVTGFAKRMASSIKFIKSKLPSTIGFKKEDFSTHNNEKDFEKALKTKLNQYKEADVEIPDTLDLSYIDGLSPRCFDLLIKNNYYPSNLILEKNWRIINPRTPEEESSLKKLDQFRIKSIIATKNILNNVVLEIFGQLKYLSKLDLSESHNISKEGIEHLSASQSLQWVNFNGTEVDKNFLGILSRIGSLETIILPNGETKNVHENKFMNDFRRLGDLHGRIACNLAEAQKKEKPSAEPELPRNTDCD